jgi:hypothetical protein
MSPEYNIIVSPANVIRDNIRFRDVFFNGKIENIDKKGADRVKGIHE